MFFSNKTYLYSSGFEPGIYQLLKRIYILSHFYYYEYLDKRNKFLLMYSNLIGIPRKASPKCIMSVISRTIHMQSIHIRNRFQ